MRLNKVLFVGRLAGDPELRYTQDGKAICTFTLAVGRANADEADFFRVVAWERLAENCAQYLKKGSGVFVEGRLKRDVVEKDGNRTSYVEIVAQSVQFLTRITGTPAKEPDTADDEPVSAPEGKEAGGQ